MQPRCGLEDNIKTDLEIRCDVIDWFIWLTLGIISGLYQSSGATSGFVNYL